MILELKQVKECKDGSYGYFKALGNSKARITISRKMNTTLAEFAATLLHELLHFYFAILKLNGFKVSNIKEHDCIYEAEEMIINIMRKTLTGR